MHLSWTILGHLQGRFKSPDESRHMKQASSPPIDTRRLVGVDGQQVEFSKGDAVHIIINL